MLPPPHDHPVPRVATPREPRQRTDVARAPLLLLPALPSLAASWRKIEPGVSSRTEVLSLFGEPSQTLKPGDKEVFVYRDGRRLKGTQQVKFRAERSTGKVDRIDVFPTVEVDRAAVESTYGPACPDNVPGPRCYLPKLTEDNRIYFHYPTQGVGVFFRPNGRIVFAFAYILAEPLQAETGATASNRSAGSGRRAGTGRAGSLRQDGDSGERAWPDAVTGRRLRQRGRRWDEHRQRGELGALRQAADRRQRLPAGCAGPVSAPPRATPGWDRPMRR